MLTAEFKAAVRACCACERWHDEAWLFPTRRRRKIDAALKQFERVLNKTAKSQADVARLLQAAARYAATRSKRRWGHKQGCHMTDGRPIVSSLYSYAKQSVRDMRCPDADADKEADWKQLLSALFYFARREPTGKSYSAKILSSTLGKAPPEIAPLLPDIRTMLERGRKTHPCAPYPKLSWDY